MEFMMITVKLEEADYLAATRLHGRWSITRWSLMILSSILVLGAGLLLLLSDGTSSDSRFSGELFICITIAAWGVQAYVRWVGMPKRVRRLFGQQKSLQRVYTLSWDDEHLKIEGADGSSSTPWSDFLKWREDALMFLLYFNDILFRIVPKRAFPDQASMQGFRRLLQQKIKQ
jgi:hypothetical protein